MIYIEGIGNVDASNATFVTPTKSYTPENFSEILNREISSEGTETLSLDEIFNDASKKYNVSCDLLKSIAYTESNFKTDVVSSSGAVGVMQLMPATASYLGVTNSYDPYQNIMGGAKLISNLLDKYNQNIDLALAAYNAGSGNVDKYNGIPPFTETINYVAKVKGYLSNNTLPESEVKNLSAMEVETVDKTKTAVEVNKAFNKIYSKEILNKEFSIKEYIAHMNYYNYSNKVSNE